MINFISRIFNKSNKLTKLKEILQSKEANVVQFQNYLFQLNDKNYSELCDFIRLNPFILQDESNIIRFILLIDHACLVRPKSINLYLQIINEFISEIKIKKIQPDEIAPIIKNPQLLYILYKEDIIDLYTIINLCSNDNFYYFEIFSDEIRQNDSYAFDYFLNYEKKRPRKGYENTTEIDKLIQILKKDELDNFIHFISFNDIKIDVFKISIFDVNINEKYYFLELFENIQQLSLLELAVAFGSELIFKYLIMNKISIQDFSIISQLAVFGHNFNIIHILEDLNIQYSISTMIMAIKCHHNDIIDYISSNYLNNLDLTKFDIFKESLSNFNFEFLFSNDIFFQHFESIANDQLSSLFNLALGLKNSDFLECLTEAFFYNKDSNQKNVSKIKINLVDELTSLQIIKFLYSNLNKFDIQRYNEYFAFVCQKGFLSISEFLLKNEKKIDVNYKSENNGKNVIFSAVENCCYNTVSFLVSNEKVDVNEAEKNYGIFIFQIFYLTPLMMASSFGNLKMVDILLTNQRIDIHLKNKIHKVFIF